LDESETALGDLTGLIVVLLVAVLVGAVLPVFYQLIQTLRSVRVFVDTTGPRIEEAMKELTSAAARLNGIASTIEKEGRRLKPIVDSAAGLGETLSSLSRSVRSAGSILGALTPAFVAGVRAFFTRDDDGEEDAGDGAARARGAGERPADEGALEGSPRSPRGSTPEGGARRGV
jgi:uncharacterized protein YoxC